MWLFIIGFLIGGLLFGILGLKIKNINEPKKEKYIRRGIYSHNYSGGPNNDKFRVQFELGELECTSTKSKVEVISMVSSRSEFNDDSTKEKIGNMVNNTWMESSNIEWIEDTAKLRNNKIDQILN